MPAQLLSLNDGPSILLDKPILLLGRHPECDVQIESRKISRRHCCIAQVSEHLVVRDLGSTNGVRINGIRVVEGKLNSGDELTIGTYRYQVVWDSAPGEPKPVPKAALAIPPAVPPPAARPPREIPRPHAPSVDELLESCDEPIPLLEPDKPALDLPGRNKLNPAAPPPAPECGLILPDNLDLLPASDVYSKGPPQPSQPPSGMG
jgi:predicted component of type VI protein secretion system